MVMEPGERRSAFVRSVLDRLGRDGWELVGVHPLWPAETSYMIFKRPASESGDDGRQTTDDAASGQPTRDLSREKGNEGEGTVDS
jgi:hypothetical protein